ncbi:MAG: hypothetical protein Q7K54_05620, partial [Candidatus Parcubacteria bacterium]|nr:hypothetical protein [Candidatus Parcubacteria bacterium]
MEDAEKDKIIQEARDIRLIIHEQEIFSEERSNEAALEFTRLEVQIAVILFGLVGVYLGSLKGTTPLVKTAFAVTIFSLIGSLALGLLHLKIIEGFWDGISSKRELRKKEWSKVINKGTSTSFENALLFQEGTKMGGSHMVAVPKWTWILQSVLLGISIITISIISI